MNQFIVIKTHVGKAHGMKAWVKGTFESLVGQTDQETEDSIVIVERDIICIDPRWIAGMTKN